MTMLEAEAKERQRAAGEDHGRGQEKLMATMPQAIHPTRSAEQAAKIVGVGKTRI